jgi:hypothetical protein
MADISLKNYQFIHNFDIHKRGGIDYNKRRSFTVKNRQQKPSAVFYQERSSDL